MVTIKNMNDLMSAVGMRADSIIVSDRVVGNSLLIAGRIQNRTFPEVVLERTAAFGEICRVSVGESLVIEVAEEIVNILFYPEKQNMELDIEEVWGRKVNLYYEN